MRSTALFLLLILGSCTSGCRSVLAPEQASTALQLAGPQRDNRAPAALAWETPSQAQVPVLAITTNVENGQWVLRATMIPRDPNPFYSVSQAGAWSLQLFFNTDQQPTGYADGYDFETGWWADEVEPFTVRGPIPSCCDWGEVSGYAGLQILRNRVTVRVPLSAIRDDGGLNWRLETFSTIACPECPSGVTAEFSDLYTGSTSVLTASNMQRVVQSGRLPRVP
jgi:hypothetical protein